MKYSVFLLILLPSVLQAQVYKCGGSWTNVPCDQVAEKPKAAKKVAPNTAKNTSKARTSKGTLLHDLRMQMLRARREHGVELSMKSAELICQDKEKSLDECIKIINSSEDRLAGRVKDAKLVAEKKRANDIAEKKAEASGTTVVIERDRPVYRRSRVGSSRREFQNSEGGVSVSTGSADGRTTISGGFSAGQGSRRGNAGLPGASTGTRQVVGENKNPPKLVFPGTGN